MIILSVKHFLIGLLLFLTNGVISDTISNITTPPNSDPLNPYILLVTVSGLILAGAIAGYFQLSFSRANDETNKVRRNILLTIGHTVTCLKLFVIGSLILICVHSLIIPIGISGCGVWLIGTVLYLSMVVYDFFDYYAELPHNA